MRWSCLLLFQCSATLSIRHEEKYCNSDLLNWVSSCPSLSGCGEQKLKCVVTGFQMCGCLPVPYFLEISLLVKLQNVPLYFQTLLTGGCAEGVGLSCFATCTSSSVPELSGLALCFSVWDPSCRLVWSFVLHSSLVMDLKSK